MSVLNGILRSIDALNDWVGRKVSLFVMLLSGLLLMETVLRYVFNSPTTWATELTQMIFGAYGVLAGGYVLRWNKHVTVDLVASRLPERVRKLIEIVTSVLFFLFCGVLLYVGGSMAWESLAGWEHSESAWNPPVYPIRMMIPIGAFLLLIQGIAKLVRDIRSLVQVDDGERPKRKEGNVHEH